MKVKDLLKLLEGVDRDATVLVRDDDGSILPIDDFEKHRIHNDNTYEPPEFFILVKW